MIISQNFTLNGVPQTGLTALITIYEDGVVSAVVSGASMTAYGNGLYYYDFTTYDQHKQYEVYFDGSATITAAGERYKTKDIGYRPI